MSTPKKRKAKPREPECSSRKYFQWALLMDETLLGLLIREVKLGNRINKTFTALAYQNVVRDINKVHGTNIMKNHVKNRIKTMKSALASFHKPLGSMSGFAWNRDTKKFDAQDIVWEGKIKENPKVAKLRDKKIHNWDKLCMLFNESRPTDLGDHAIGTPTHSAGGESSFGENDPQVGAGEPNSPDYASSEHNSRVRLKRKSSLAFVLEDGAKIVSDSIEELSKASTPSVDKVARREYGVGRYARIFSELSSIGLTREYLLTCYCYLCRNPTMAAAFFGVPPGMRARMLGYIMKHQEKKD